MYTYIYIHINIQVKLCHERHATSMNIAHKAVHAHVFPWLYISICILSISMWREWIYNNSDAHVLVKMQQNSWKYCARYTSCPYKDMHIHTWVHIYHKPQGANTYHFYVHQQIVYVINTSKASRAPGVRQYVLQPQLIVWESLDTSYVRHDFCETDCFEMGCNWEWLLG